MRVVVGVGGCGRTVPGERWPSGRVRGPGGAAAGGDGLCASRDCAGLVDLLHPAGGGGGAGGRCGRDHHVYTGWPLTGRRRCGQRAPARGRARFSRWPAHRVPAHLPHLRRLAPHSAEPAVAGPSPRSGSCAARTCAAPLGPMPRCWSCRWSWPPGSRPTRWPPTGPTSARSPTRVPRRWPWWPAGPTRARPWTGPTSPGPSSTWSRSGPRSRAARPGRWWSPAARPRRWPPSAIRARRAGQPA